MTKTVDCQYRKLVEAIISSGEWRQDRTGTGTLALFSPSDSFMRLDLRQGFPLLNVRRLYWKNQVRELLWFLSGSTNVNDLPEKVQHWWRPWADENGDLGPTYGYQFRGDGGYDPFSELIEGIRRSPMSRRHVLTMWHNELSGQTGLNPCHGTVIQFYVAKGGYLDMSTYQRSADTFIGLPNNIGSYAFLQHLVAAMVGLEARYMGYGYGDVHLYSNHLPFVKTLNERWGEAEEVQAPRLEPLPRYETVDEYVFDDFVIEGYTPLSAIKGVPVAV